MKLKNIFLTAAISLSALIANTSKAEAQLAPLNLSGKWEGHIYSVIIHMPTDNINNKPYKGTLSWADIAIAQAYGYVYDNCIGRFDYPKPDNFRFRVRFYSNNKHEGRKAFSCGKARELASKYGVNIGRIHNQRLIYTYTLNLDSSDKVNKFRRFSQSIGLGK